MTKRCLITGGAGFMGRHLVQRCKREGWHVTIVDNLSSGLAPEDWSAYLYGLNDFPNEFVMMNLREWLLRNPQPAFDLIFHCAAVVGGRLKIEGDPLAVATDLAIDSDFFNWAVKLKYKPERVVYFSSSAVYPIEFQTQHANCLLMESLTNFQSNRIGMPDMTYGWAKLTGEYLARHAHVTYDLPVVIYRPFSGYGEDQDHTYPFPAIIQRAANFEDPVQVWGSGEQVRDFVHIDDCVEAVFQSMFKLLPGQVLNIGTGTPTSFRKLVNIACDVAGYNPGITFDATKPEGVFWRVSDPYQLEQYYKPQISLKEGVERGYKHLLTRERQPA